MDLLDDDTLSKFQSEYLDYLEGCRDEPPSRENLSEEGRRIADALVLCSKAGAAASAADQADDADACPPRPSIEELLARSRLAASSDEMVVNAVDRITRRLARDQNGQTPTPRGRPLRVVK